MKNTFGRFINWYERIYNRYGFSVLELTSESGKADGTVIAKNKYYLQRKKIYANRYSTDCYSEFFRKRALSKQRGFADFSTFSDIKASADELNKMNSYFIRDIEHISDTDDKNESG